MTLPPARPPVDPRLVDQHLKQLIGHYVITIAMQEAELETLRAQLAAAPPAGATP